VTVMESYLDLGAASGAVFDELGSIPAPPGTSLGQLSAQGMFAEISTALGLQPVGVFTPWASRTGDVAWDEIKRPDTNVMAWSLSDEQIGQATAVTFGQPLPFVVVATKGPLSQAQVAAMWEGTAYAPYETQAVYRQDDAMPIPTIFFMHWGERIDMGQLPKQVLAIAPRALQVGGQLLFAAQIPVQGSTTRAAPAMSFDNALTGQLAINVAPAVPVPTPAAITQPAPPGGAAIQPPATRKLNLGVPIVVGIGAAALGFWFWKRR
jgi:hypothetical protein